MEKLFLNKRANEEEIAQKKIKLESLPIRLGVTLTTRCNLQCVMCEVRKVSWDIPKKTIDEILEYLPYLEYIMWLGGEVFYSNHFEELFEKAAANPYLQQAIFTNGILINEKWAEKLAKSNVVLNYSIDGFSKNTYELIRKGAKFEELLKSIELINKYDTHEEKKTNCKKFIKGINFTVMESNYHEVGIAVDFAKKYEFDLLTINFMHVSEPKDIFFYKDLAAKQYIEKTIPEVINKAKEYSIRLNAWIPSVQDEFPQAKNAKKKQKQGKCNDNTCKGEGRTDGPICYLPWQHLFIEAEGRVKPFCLCKTEIGNIDKKPLCEIWNDEMMQFYRQKLIDNNYTDLCNYRCVSGVIPEAELKPR